MHILAKTANKVKKEEEKKLVQVVEHTCESFFFPLISFRVTSAGIDADQNTGHLSLQGSFGKNDPATQRPAELRPLLASAAGRVNGVMNELRRRSGYHVAFSSAEIEAAVK